MLFLPELHEKTLNIVDRKNYKKIDIEKLLIDKQKTLNKFCTKYNRIFTTGEVKDLERRWGTNWCKFNLFSGQNKLQCITKVYNADLVNNKLYQLYGNMSNGKYGLQFNVKCMDLVKNKLSPFEELYTESKNRNYFLNKKNVNLCEINNIVLLSKKDTQGCCDFMEHMKIPLNISIKNVTLEGENTSTDIITNIKKINQMYEKENVSCDLILILRGGGSTSDISKSFDKIDIFEAIRNSKIPIGTAIGHTKDNEDKLLITSVSDINFDTPSIAASCITNSCKKFFYELKETYRKQFCKLIDDNINCVDNFFQNAINNKSQKIKIKLEDLKKKLIKSILAYPIVELGDIENIIYVPDGVKFKRCRVIIDEYVEINPKDVEFINQMDNLKDIKILLSRMIGVNMDPIILKEMEKCFKENENLRVTIKKYNELKARKNRLYLKKLPDVSFENIHTIKEILLYNKEYITICANDKLETYEFGMDEYNFCKQEVKITTDMDIYTLFKYLNYILDL